MMSKIFHSLIFRFIVVTLVFFAATAPIIVLFGPFGNLKRAVVGAIMRSRHPQYITWLYNQEELNEILGVVKTTEQTQVLSFKPRTDSTLSLQKIETTRFVGYLLEIPNPQRIQVATAEDIQEKGDTTSRIAKKNNAVAAINGGGFYDPNGTGTGRLPYGFIIHEGKYLLGQQVDDKERVDFIGMTRSGNLIAGNYNKKELHDLGVTEGLTFGPPLIMNGKKVIRSGDGGWGISPRSAIGQKKDGTMMFLVIDGRQPGYSIGATLVDVQNIMYEKGAYIAANLDGGSSTTLYYNGNVVNKPADLLGERMIPTAFIVK
jgi:exopolysaccharide biosynthesis protein